MSIVHPRLTIARRYWLKRLRDEGPQPILGQGPTNNHLLRLGWVDWLMERNGERLPREEVVGRYDPTEAGSWHRAGEDGWSFVPGSVVIITAEGRQALERDAAGTTPADASGGETVRMARKMLADAKGSRVDISRRLLADLIALAVQP